MPRCFFVSDLHGSAHRYRALALEIEREPPDAVFLGGDLFPHAFDPNGRDDLIGETFEHLRSALAEDYPRVFLILGNDDLRVEEKAMLEGEAAGRWSYVHGRSSPLGRHTVFGYACVPPTPFHLKDWERYDVSRYVDPGCVSPEEGRRSVPVPGNEVRFRTIQKDLGTLVKGAGDLSEAIFLLHAPPYRTKLDRAALDGKMIDHAPLDVHVGSIAVERFIRDRQPLLTLHGHVHESTRLTGSWRDRIGRTEMFNAAHHGPELALVRFDTEDLSSARRDLL